jgi:hypothetical protein
MDYRSSVPPALALLFIAVPAAQASHIQTVRVGFATPVATPSMVGFVHGMNKRAPHDDMVKPLGPALWRSTLRDLPYRRVQEVGGRYVYILSDRWGYPGDGMPPPYEDFGGWERFVREAARTSRRADGEVLWDVWNEPNQSWFWQGTPE